MNTSDIINGLFECLSAIFVLLNIVQLYRDKQVKGVSVVASCFFTMWGFWNLYFYPHNGLFLSFVGGCFIVLFNCIWVGQMFYYNKLNYKRKKCEIKT